MKTKQDVLNIFDYDASTGKFYWKTDRRNGAKAGTEAGFTTLHGYRSVRVYGKVYRIHRLIWLVETGMWPTGYIDHIDHNRSNNLISNLRDVTCSENNSNQKTPRSKSGFWGVEKRKGRYACQLRVGGRTRYLGKRFKTATQAAVYRELFLHSHPDYYGNLNFKEI